MRLMRQRTKAGFSLVEAMFSMGLFGMVAAMLYGAFIDALLDTRAGTSQARFTAMARASEQQILRYVQKGMAIWVSDNSVIVWSTNNTVGSIYYLDGDGNPGTVEDNKLVYLPSLWAAEGSALTISTHISRIGDKPFFSLVPTSPDSVGVCYHVGDGLLEDDRSAYKSGAGYQGVEVRFAATPRNLQLFHQ